VPGADGRAETGAEQTDDGLAVREMTAEEIDLRIRYFHEADDAYLHMLGVDRALLPAPQQMRSAYLEQLELPISERSFYVLVWLRQGQPAGFSSLDHIVCGAEAFMHLHVLDPTDRGRGLGTAFVRLSAAHYTETFALERLYCEPNACNVAPNRTLQRAGFRYCFSHETTPGPINFRQVTTRWVWPG
jgi:RimJ/RimL family protein N-acetyltransferase